MPPATDRDVEIERNLFAFQSHLSDLLRDFPDQYALMRERKVVSIHSKLSSAVAEGHLQFEDGRFSIQKVADEPIDLGFFSHATDSR